MEPKVKVGVIGVGKMGLLHLGKLAHHPEVELAGVHDLDFARAEQAAKDHGTRPVRQLNDLLFECDAVVLAAPTATHYPIGRQVLEAGTHLLVEKPIARDPAEAETLVNLARERNVVLQVGLLERQRYMALAEGLKLTPVRFIESHRLSPSLGREGHEVDVVMDLMIHDLDLVLSLIHEDPSVISAVGVSVLTSSCDLANVRLEFPGGAVTNLTASRVSARSMRKFRVFSLESYASMDFVANSVDAYYRGQTSPIEHKVVERMGFDALKEQADCFVRAVKGIAPPAVSGADALRALKVAAVIREKIAERMASGPKPPHEVAT